MKRILQMYSKRLCYNPEVPQTLQSSRPTFNMPRADGPCQQFSHIMATPIFFFLLAPRHNFLNSEKTQVVAIYKQKNRKCKNYRLIELLCVPFKTLERLIYTRIKLIMDPLLPHEQAVSFISMYISCRP